MKILVTGGAGFIGSALVDEYLQKDHQVVVIDNLISGNPDFFKKHQDNENFTFKKHDCQSCDEVSDLIIDSDYVFHFAANPDVRKSQANPDLDFENNIRATYNLLRCLSKSKSLKKFIFSSSSVVYGEPSIIPTPETYGPLVPISSYGATKLSCEAMISAFSHQCGFKTIILRFANVIGPKSNHGIIFDFINKLKTNPKTLEILGNGKQSKSYLYISDCISGIKTAVENSKKDVEIFNLGTDNQTSVDIIAQIVIDEMSLKDVKCEYSDMMNGRGWSGDVKIMQLDCSKLRSIGWSPEFTSEQAVANTVKHMLEN